MKLVVKWVHFSWAVRSVCVFELVFSSLVGAFFSPPDDDYEGESLLL